MALQDILAAITSAADARIKQARDAQQNDINTFHEESATRVEEKKKDIAVSKQQKSDSLLTKANTHAETLKRNARLSTKKELLDELYSDVAKKLSTLPEKEVEPLLRECVKKLADKGDIFPSKAHAALLKKICPSEKFTIKEPTDSSGGFLFVSKKREQDFTFDYLVQNVLRPKTELEVSHQLFS